MEFHLSHTMYCKHCVNWLRLFVSLSEGIVVCCLLFTVSDANTESEHQKGLSFLCKN